MIKHFFYSGSGQTIKMQTENLGVVCASTRTLKMNIKECYTKGRKECGRRLCD